MNVSRVLSRRITLQQLKKYGFTYSQSKACATAGPNKLMSQFQAKIRFNGPITVAEYMRASLTHASEGYYIKKDVFGEKGDFTTSPEVSQMFGELVGIWFVNEWHMAGSPNRLQIVELGPGRGTMADDMLRAFSNFPDFNKAVSLHLVEVSEKLSEIQQNNLCGSASQATVSTDDSAPYYKHCTSKYGNDVFWYRDIRQVPDGLTMFVAHEFFDALPIHKFQKKDNEWSEILVDIDPADDAKLRFVLAPADTPATVAYLKISDEYSGKPCGEKGALDEHETRNHIEICPEIAVTVKYIANRIRESGGSALFVDYGHCGEKEDTFRGFKNHELHDVLVDPGSADLTADVDFMYLLKQAADLVQTYGPVTQAHFLQNMGIALRLKLLYEKAKPEDRKNLVTAFNMLMAEDQMGERFKFVALLHNDAEHDPVGFDPIPVSGE